MHWQTYEQGFCIECKCPPFSFLRIGWLSQITVNDRDRATKFSLGKAFKFISFGLLFNCFSGDSSHKCLECKMKCMRSRNISDVFACRHTVSDMQLTNLLEAIRGDSDKDRSDRLLRSSAAGTGYSGR